jgi:anti-sigma regulatory factor (Ser/Thr protein kinase)
VSASPLIEPGKYSHDLLLHEGEDAWLVEGTRAFVQRGLESGGHVLVHSSEERVALLQRALGSHPRLEYGLDQDLYLTPTRTLFAYQRKLEETEGPLDLWATGTVPLGADVDGHAAWARYESLVNEVLGPYSFHGLCTYDVSALPAGTIAAAKASHPHITAPEQRVESPTYLSPSEFRTHPLAAVPPTPASPPTLMTILDSRDDLSGARSLLRDGISSSRLPAGLVQDFVAAVNEVLTNGLEHGLSNVQLEVWVEPGRLICQVIDDGPGGVDPLTGFAYPHGHQQNGLWVARQLCDDIFVTDRPHGGTQVLLVASA